MVLAIIGSLSYVSFRLTGGFVLAIVAATAGLTLARLWLPLVIGGASMTSADRVGITILVVQADDSAFTGGIVRWGNPGVFTPRPTG